MADPKPDPNTDLALDRALRGSLTQWTKFFEWPRGYYVIQRSSGDPESVCSTPPEGPEAIAERAGIDPAGVLAIFEAINPYEVFEVSRRDGYVRLKFTRHSPFERGGDKYSLSRHFEADDSAQAILPELGVGFGEIIRDAAAALASPQTTRGPS